MLAYTVIGSNNKAQALEFYDALVAELGGQRTFANERLQFYSNGQGAMLGVGTPSNEESATFGNGTMPAFGCADTATVDRVYNKAIELGATCEGALVHISATMMATSFAQPALQIRNRAHSALLMV